MPVAQQLSDALQSKLERQRVLAVELAQVDEELFLSCTRRIACAKSGVVKVQLDLSQ